MCDEMGGSGGKICVTSQRDGLDSLLDPRFGRCQYFIFINPDTLEFEAIQNPNISAMGGAGIQSAQLVADKEVTTVLTGNVGPNAFQTLRAAGIEIITGVTGSIRDVVALYKEGKLKPTENPSVSSKFGMRGSK